MANYSIQTEISHQKWIAETFAPHEIVFDSFIQGCARKKLAETAELKQNEQVKWPEKKLNDSHSDEIALNLKVTAITSVDKQENSKQILPFIDGNISAAPENFATLTHDVRQTISKIRRTNYAFLFSIEIFASFTHARTCVQYIMYKVLCRFSLPNAEQCNVVYTSEYAHVSVANQMNLSRASFISYSWTV